MNLLKPTAVALLSALAVGQANADTTLFSENFEGAVVSPQIGGFGGRVSSGGYSAYGFGNQMWRNTAYGNPAASTTLSFTLGSSASGAKLNFYAGFIDSWDGRSGGCCNPDLLNVKVDGASIMSFAVNNVFGKVPGFGGTAVTDSIPNATLLVDASEGHNLAGEWYGSNGYDSGYRFTFNLGTLSAGNHTIEWFASGAGWQGGSDESFSIDNISVTAVPEPETYGLLLAGLGLMGVVARRKRNAVIN